jgi:hypothetical protein
MIMSDVLHVPPIVQRLANQNNLLPLTWFVADDHVEIVNSDGKKYRFALPLAPEAALAAAPSARKPANPAAAHPAAAAPSKPKPAPRGRAKK